MDDTQQIVETMNPETNSAEPKPNGGINPVLVIFLAIPLIGMVIAVLIAVGNSPTDSALPTPRPAAYTPFTLVNNTAPDFSLPDGKGGTLNLSDFRGKWVIVNFWATWCPPCVDEMPLLQAVVDGRTDIDADQWVVLAVNNGEPIDVGEQFLEDHNLNLPVAYDTETRVVRRYSIIQMPTTYIVNPEGVVVYQHIGVLTDRIIAAIWNEFGEPA
jgi:peroxiredoxin